MSDHGASIGVRFPDRPLISIKMKAYAEHIVENSIKELLQTLQRNVTDTGAALDMYEMTHDDYESDQSKQYSALVAGHFALQEAIEKINNQLNKK